MVKRVQRYGLTSGAMAAFTGLVRELIVNTTRNSIHVHDGVTAGGVETMRADGTNGSLATSGAQGLLSVAGYNVVNGIGTLPVPILQGGTGATTASAARTNLGLGTAAVANTGASGANIPFLNGANSWSNVQTLVSFPINEAQGADIASATNPALGAATGNYVNITGTTTIAGFDTIQAGTRRKVKFAGILQLTYNATSFILPSVANITTAAGDQAEFVSLGSGNWICTNYMRATGKPLINPAGLVIAGTPCVKNPMVGLTVTTTAHALSGTPDFIQGYLECLSADLGYAVGDRIHIGWSSSGVSGVQFEWDATNCTILIVTGSSYTPLTKTDASLGSAITYSKWKAVIQPFKVT